MKTIVVVSKCIKISRYSAEEHDHLFHFKGVFAGARLHQLRLLGRKEFNVIRGRDYLMYVRMLSCEDGVLKGRILKIKDLEECWDKS